jgi:hypothetical protein
LWRTHKDYIYYRCASNNLRLVSDDYLICIENPIGLDDDTMEVLLQLQESHYFALAGGFFTQCYLGNIPKDTSDIDVFVLGGLGEKEAFKEFRKFFKWFEERFGSDTKVFDLGSGNSIFSIEANSAFRYDIQFILTNYHSLGEVLSSFDNSHNRCGMYNGNFYVAPDAKISKDRNITYFYKIVPLKRYRKAKDLGFHIQNFTEEQNLALFDDNFTVVKNREGIFKALGDFNRDNLESSDFKFIKQWLNVYANENKAEIKSFLNSREIDVLSDEFEKVRKDLVYKYIKPSKSSKEPRLHIYIRKSTMTRGLTIEEPVKFISYLNLTQSDRMFSYSGDIKLLRELKCRLLKLMTASNGLSATPLNILRNTKDLIGLKELQANLYSEESKKYIKGLTGVKEKSFCGFRFYSRMTGEQKKFLRDYENGNLDLFAYYGFYPKGCSQSKTYPFFHFGYEYRDNITLDKTNSIGYIRIKNFTEDNIIVIDRNQLTKIYKVNIEGNKVLNEEKANWLSFGGWSFSGFVYEN